MKRDFKKGSGELARLAFTVCKRFGPEAGERWHSYVTWARLPQLSELVTLDPMLCERAVGIDCPEDWAYNIHEDIILDLFWDLDYVLRKVSATASDQVLATARNPVDEPGRWVVPPGFVFCGHDLTDEQSSISALTNCGGFDDVFRPEELSELGLIQTWSRACEVQRLLAERHPEEPHARCNLWAVWRLE